MASRRPPSTFAAYGKPRAAEGGLRARSRRGDIGETWWSKRFIAVLESHEIGGRLARGRQYARKGQVLGVDLAAGEVTAEVQGSERKPYAVRIEVPVFPPTTVAAFTGAVRERVALVARLLAGEMPADLEEVCEGLGLTLFPAGKRDLLTSCSCPDVSNPCKHVAAVLYVLAERFDEDPFLVLAWRGLSRASFLAALDGAGGASVPSAPSPAATGGRPAVVRVPLEAADLRGFWGSGDRPRAPLPAPSLSRPQSAIASLGPLGISAGGRDLAEALEAAVAEIALGLGGD